MAESDLESVEPFALVVIGMSIAAPTDDDLPDPRHRYSGPQEQPWDLPENDMKDTHDILLDMEKRQGGPAEEGWFERQPNGMTSPLVSGHLVSTSQSLTGEAISMTGVTESPWPVLDGEQQSHWEDTVRSKNVTTDIGHPSDSVNHDEKNKCSGCEELRKQLHKLQLENDRLKSLIAAQGVHDSFLIKSVKEECVQDIEQHVPYQN